MQQLLKRLGSRQLIQKILQQAEEDLDHLVLDREELPIVLSNWEEKAAQDMWTSMGFTSCKNEIKTTTCTKMTLWACRMEE